MDNPAKKGRGALDNPSGRFEAWRREAVDEGGSGPEGVAPATELFPDAAKSVISRNDSPDLPFSQSINPYRGCEHGCIYCYARPTHAYLGLSPGLDFETKIAYKAAAAALLRAELARPGYACAPIALGTNTDCYQPAERRLHITRGIVELLAACRHPLTIVTKSALVERDLDLLAPMAAGGLVQVMFSLTTLDWELARRLEPRAAPPRRRLEAMARLAQAGVPVGVLAAPVIPALTDHELEAILAAAREAGASQAAYTLLRLPGEVKELFASWLAAHAPGRAAHVLSLVRQMRGGRLDDPAFGSRMKGEGLFAELIAQRFRAACRRLGLNDRELKLDCSRFRPPQGDAAQLELF
jgi:DNA repair photolyase